MILNHFFLTFSFKLQKEGTLVKKLAVSLKGFHGFTRMTLTFCFLEKTSQEYVSLI